MADPDSSNAKESISAGWIRFCACGGEGWPQVQSGAGIKSLRSPIAVECFGSCGAVGPQADSEEESVALWNEMQEDQ